MCNDESILFDDFKSSLTVKYALKYPVYMIENYLS